MDFYHESEKKKALGSIVVFLLAALILVSVFAAPVSGQQTDNSSIGANSHFCFSTSSDNLSAKGNAVLGHRQQLNPIQNNTVGTATSAYAPDSTGQVWLGSFNGSYLQPVYIPVYSSELGSFNNLTQIFSYDPSILSFYGTLNDVASQNVTFSYSMSINGVVKIQGTGSFYAGFKQTLLYYLIFNSSDANRTLTSVLLDNSILGTVDYPVTYLSTVKLIKGWTNLGPHSISAPGMIQGGGAGTVDAVGYSPHNMSVIYVASGSGGPWGGGSVYGFGGIYRSDNGGLTWSPVDRGLNSSLVEAVAVDPHNPDVLVISTGGLGSIVGGHIYKSVNGGQTWQETYNVGGDYLSYDNGFLYAASYHAILSSDNFGSTWNIVSNFSYLVTTMAETDNGSTILVGTSSFDIPYGNTVNTGEIFRSTDSGSNYSVVATFPGYNTVSQIVVNPSNHSNVWALVYQGYTSSPNLFESNTGGSTWNTVNDTAVGIKNPVVNVTLEDSFYVTEPLSYSANETSRNASADIYEVPQGIAIDPINGSIIYVIGPGYVYKSTDFGKHFINLGDEYGQNIGQDNRIINIDPLNDSVMFIGSDQGLIVTYNGGESWTGIDNRSSNMLYDVAADGSNIFTTVQDWSPLFSDNYGKTWYQTQVSEEGFVAVDPYNSSIIIHVPPWNNPVEVSNDGGDTFFLSNVNQTELFVQARDSPNPIAFGPRTIYIAGKAGIFYSNNSGESFALISGSPNNTLSGVGAIAVSPSDPNVIYASNYEGLFVSYDYGFSWKEINNVGNVASIVVDPFNSSLIYFDIFNGDTYDSLYVSFNGGVSYEELNKSSNDNFAAPPTISAFDHLNSLYLVYTSGNGIYLSNDGGKSWLNISYNLRTLVVSSFYLSPNGSAYLSTYGSGVWYDSDLFNMSYSVNEPILSGYLPKNDYVTIDGVTINSTGLFTFKLTEGNNTIYVASLGKVISMNAVLDHIYFENFSDPFTQVEVKEIGLPIGTSFTLSIGAQHYLATNNETLQTAVGNYNFSIIPYSDDFTIYEPDPQYGSIYGFQTENVLNIHFYPISKAEYYNLSKEISNNTFWTTSLSYNKDEILYAGGGNVVIMNASSGLVYSKAFPSSNGGADTTVPFLDGFLIGGSASPDRPGIFYFNLSTQEFENISQLLPYTWNSTGSGITSISVINSSAFSFIGSGTSSTYFGEIRNGRFLNFTPYLTLPFMQTNDLYEFSEAYLSASNRIIITTGKSVGTFNLTSDTFQDITSLFYTGGQGFDFGHLGNVYNPSSDYVASNGSSAMLIGYSPQGPLVELYNPEKGISDLSNLFPHNEYEDAVTWEDGDFVLSGYASSKGSPSIFVYNTTKNLETELNTSTYGSISLIDDAIKVDNSFFFTTFNSKPIPGTKYVADFSYYGEIKLTPIGSVHLMINIPSTIEVDNEKFYENSITVPEFAGNYSFVISSPGFDNYTETIDIIPFKIQYLNVTMEPKSYEITFREIGLAAGTVWTVTLNNLTKSSTGSISFSAPNGTYSYSIGKMAGYTVLTQSGVVTVNGKSVSESITFNQIEQNGYFAGSVSPPNAIISILINGSWESYKENNGSFNISLNPGTYGINISAPGYTAYTTNITVSSSTVTSLSIHSLSKVSGPSSFPVLLLVIAIVIIASLAVAAVALVRFRKRT